MSAPSLRFDEKATQAYDRFMGRWSRLFIPTLLERAGVGRGQRVLDVATGTGEATLLAAAGVGPSGSVIGTDISLPMLRGAAPRVAGHPIALAAMDGQALAFRDRAFDAVVCQLGLMFFPDVEQGLSEFRRVLSPGGRLAVCVWSKRERTPLVGILAEALSRHVPPLQDDLNLGFSLGDPLRLERLLGKAGFRNVRVIAETRSVVFDSFEDYWEPVEAGGGRLGQIYRGLPEEARRAVEQEVRRRMATFHAGGRLVMDVEALFGVARSSG